MRPGGDTPTTPVLTRRALGACLAAGTAAISLGHRAIAAPVAAPAMDPGLRDAALRGLALAEYRGDPVGAAAARAAALRLAQADPEGALLLRLYRKLDVLPSQSWRADLPPAAETDLAALHDAIRDCRPVRFGYTDLSDQKTRRTVLPLALVNPPQGVKLLAWCLKAEDYRQFMVRAMCKLTPQDGDFKAERMVLLQGLAEKEGA